ncbi:MAG: hypothetical protein AAGI88_11350 [Pseudomonadota bacterium]
MKTLKVLLVLTLCCVAIVAVASQSRLAKNAFYAVFYERQYDAYSQTDTTPDDDAVSTSATSGDAALLSAFYGIDNALPLLASRVICKGARGQDGMPVIFSHELDPKTVEPGDFRVVTRTGVPGSVACLTLAPADDNGELRTVLLVGQFGNNVDQPVSVEVVGNVLSWDRRLNFKGVDVRVTPLEAGPSLVRAEVVPKADWSLGQPATGIPFGGGSGCPLGTKQIVRVTWEGGVTKPSGEDADQKDAALYALTFIGQDGVIRQGGPFALADLGDGDNNHKLCIDTNDQITSVSFPAGYLTDPRDDLNPATTIAITSSESPRIP